MSGDFFFRSRWRPIDYLAGLVSIALAGWLSTPLIWPASSWIVINRVHIFDAQEGEDPAIEVDRILYRSTEHGRYIVTIRNANTHLPECVATRHVPYDANANTGPIRDKTLKWWAYSEDGECFRWPVPEGNYYAVTQHCWKRYWWTKEACNTPTVSNTNTVSRKP